jgi:hypothetical protein
MIRLILLDGDPEGLRSAAIAGRTTVLLACPWTRLKTLLARDEAKRPAIYFLVGTPLMTSDTGFEQSIYVGECDSLAERFSGGHHKAEAAEWNQIFLATTSEGTFNKAHARLAEYRLRDRAADARRAEVLTMAASEGRIDEGDAAFAGEFVDNVVLLAQTLGLTLFRPPVSRGRPAAAPSSAGTAAASVALPIQTTPTEPDLFAFDHRKGEVIRAQMAVDGTEFVVLAGSLARADDLEGLSNTIRQKRVSAREAGVLKADVAGFERFTQDYPTGSPSTAGSMVYGSACAGPIAWRHIKSGLLYKDWLMKEASA